MLDCGKPRKRPQNLTLHFGKPGVRGGGRGKVGEAYLTPPGNPEATKIKNNANQPDFQRPDQSYRPYRNVHQLFFSRKPKNGK